MVLTEEQKQDIYPAATLEGNINTDVSPNAVFKEKDYYTIDPSNIALKTDATGITNYPNHNGNPPVNPNPNSNTTANSEKLYPLHGSTNKTGLGITLKVMAGDRIDIFGKSYYFQNNTGGTGANIAIPTLEIVTGLLGVPTGGIAAASHGGVSAGDLNSSSGTTNGITTMLTDQTTNAAGAPTVPKAYINYIFFDEQFKVVTSGFSKVGSNSVVKTHTDLTDKIATKSGYVYIYVSNESPVPVFFDNVQVIHTRSPILEETHYYPFGLTMAGISSKGLNGIVENKYKYNGYENNTDFDLNLNESFYRTHDPQIGRFWQIDPKAVDEISPYVSMLNNPILMSDPLGDTTTYYDTNGNTLYTTLSEGYNRAFIIGDEFLETFTNVFNGLKEMTLENQTIFDNIILEANEKHGYGDAYDLASINKFYEDNYASEDIHRIGGISIDRMSDMKLDGKSISKGHLKGMKGAEVTANFVKKGGVWVIDQSSRKTDNDLMGAPFGNRSNPYAHLHSFTPKLLGKTLEFSYQARFGKVSTRLGPFGKAIIPSTGQNSDVSAAKSEGKIGTKRNVVVNYSHIYLYDGNSIGIQIKR